MKFVGMKVILFWYELHTVVFAVWFIYRVEGAIRCGLDSPVEESDEETDETAPNGYQATIVSDQGWIDANVAELSPLTLKHIHQYFITGRLSVSPQQSHSRGDTGCLTQRRSNAYQFTM